MAKNKKTFLIIDSHALIHRAYHAIQDPMNSFIGQPTNAVYGFTSVLIKVLKDLKPTHVIAAFDLPGPTFRHKAYKEYKANRPETDADLKSQFSLVREILEAFEIPILEHEGFEADDVIGTVVRKLKNKDDIKVIIVTGDLDTLQLVDGEKSVVYTLKRGVNDTIIYNDEKVKERFGGLGPDQMIDFKGLKGDPSDNIPGVPGIGEKTAIQLLSDYKSLENLYKVLEEADIKPKLKERLIKNKDQAFFSKELATIKQNIPINFSLNDARFSFVVGDKIKKSLERFGFRSLMRRLEKEKIFETPQLFTEAASYEDKSRPNETGQEEKVNEEENNIEDYYERKIFSKKIYELELELTPVLKKMEKAGFLIDTSALNNLNKKISKELSSIHKKVISLSGVEFNLNSPQEVGQIIFGKLKLGGSRPKTTKTGQYSTTAAELEKIKYKHDIIPLLLHWRELSKLKSTYLEAIPRLISPKDGRIHTTFKQLGAVTGRLSSENPNLQNIPIRGEYGKEIRKAFIVKEGFTLLSCDYSQIELRIAAALSGDKKMLEAFNSGEDIHTRTAVEIFNVKFEDVDKDMRRTAKILNFGIQYGMGIHSFSISAGVSLDEAKKFMGEYKSDFTGLTAFLINMKSQAYKKGYIETIWGRRRYLPELNSSNPGLRAAGERMAINMPIQGTAADIIKAAMIIIDKEISDKKDINMILQVHDELLFEVKKESVKKYISFIKKAMEKVMDLRPKLIVDVEIGPNWGEMEAVKS